ncbi:MAG: hypothetical protein H6667_14970 [Ardenticatenaceae bacterium]|nr:hypothetical protein [Ardenticatenaceae bacterium]MCB9444560.1 hypothetical protein [Ardenticatenaceae bacterium]
MIQSPTQKPEYWEENFTLTDSDIEQIYNHFLEVEKPQTAAQIARVVIAYRVAEEQNKVARQLAGRMIYQPKNSYAVGDELVFPVLGYANGTISAVREGYNPQFGTFSVVAANINGKSLEFASQLDIEHPLNQDAAISADALTVDLKELYARYETAVTQKIAQSLGKSENFVRIGQQWFIKGLMAEINIGHLHLSEAILEMSGGGPLTVDEILPHLDMDSSLDKAVQAFSLNYGLQHDARFDEVAPRGKIAWFLRRLEPDEVQKIPERLQYTPIPYDKALLSHQLLLLVRELDDEWSDLPVSKAESTPQTAVFTLLYPHRLSGTMPLSSRTIPFFPSSTSPRQRVVFIDETTQEEIEGWVVKEHRYVYGLGDWYEENGIPIGGFIHMKAGPEPGVIYLGYDRRRAQREWVRLATAVENRIKFDLMRRSVGCGFDDLMIVGTDVVTAIDALRRRAESHQRSIASLIAELFPELAEANPQNTVHAKTIYSAINMLRRTPPGPLFAELVRHPAFQSVGDHYWQFDQARWQKGS